MWCNDAQSVCSLQVHTLPGAAARSPRMPAEDCVPAGRLEKHKQHAHSLVAVLKPVCRGAGGRPLVCSRAQNHAVWTVMERAAGAWSAWPFPGGQIWIQTL